MAGFFSYKVLNFLVYEGSSINTQIANTVKFMTELLDVLFTFDKVSVLNGAEWLLETGEPSEA